MNWVKNPVTGQLELKPNDVSGALDGRTRVKRKKQDNEDLEEGEVREGSPKRYKKSRIEPQQKEKEVSSRKKSVKKFNEDIKRSKAAVTKAEKKDELPASFSQQTATRQQPARASKTESAKQANNSEPAQIDPKPRKLKRDWDVVEWAHESEGEDDFPPPPKKQKESSPPKSQIQAQSSSSEGEVAITKKRTTRSQAKGRKGGPAQTTRATKAVDAAPVAAAVNKAVKKAVAEREEAKVGGQGSASAASLARAKGVSKRSSAGNADNMATNSKKETKNATAPTSKDQVNQARVNTDTKRPTKSATSDSWKPTGKSKGASNIDDVPTGEKKETKKTIIPASKSQAKKSDPGTGSRQPTKPATSASSKPASNSKGAVNAANVAIVKKLGIKKAITSVSKNTKSEDNITEPVTHASNPQPEALAALERPSSSPDAVGGAKEAPAKAGSRTSSPSEADADVSFTHTSSATTPFSVQSRFQAPDTPITPVTPTKQHADEFESGDKPLAEVTTIQFEADDTIAGAAESVHPTTGGKTFWPETPPQVSDVEDEEDQPQSPINISSDADEQGPDGEYDGEHPTTAGKTVAPQFFTGIAILPVPGTIPVDYIEGYVSAENAGYARPSTGGKTIPGEATPKPKTSGYGKGKGNRTGAASRVVKGLVIAEGGEEKSEQDEPEDEEMEAEVEDGGASKKQENDKEFSIMNGADPKAREERAARGLANFKGSKRDGAPAEPFMRRNTPHTKDGSLKLKR